MLYCRFTSDGSEREDSLERSSSLSLEQSDSESSGTGVVPGAGEGVCIGGGVITRWWARAERGLGVYARGVCWQGDVNVGGGRLGDMLPRCTGVRSR
jgi:hypothetical protein